MKLTFPPYCCQHLPPRELLLNDYTNQFWVLCEGALLDKTGLVDGGPRASLGMPLNQ